MTMQTCPINKIYNAGTIPHGKGYLAGQIPKFRGSQMDFTLNNHWEMSVFKYGQFSKPPDKLICKA